MHYWFFVDSGFLNAEYLGTILAMQLFKRHSPSGGQKIDCKMPSNHSWADGVVPREYKSGRVVTTCRTAPERGLDAEPETVAG